MRFKGRSIEKNEYKCSFMNEECGDKYQGETEREEINLQNEKREVFHSLNLFLLTLIYFAIL